MNRQKTFSAKFSALLLAGAVSLTLSACQTTTAGSDDAKINAALERVAKQTSESGNKVESMAVLEKLYKRDSENPDIAARYARSLRQNGRITRALMILRPFAEDEKLENVTVDTEYAALNAASGHYIDAESYARKAVLQDPESGKGYHLLGIALDAQGKHGQAETAFRKALDYWVGDPSPVLNNLGLNLASQGFFDESLEKLRQAAATSDGREEIERNIRIISTLQSSIPHGARGNNVPPLPNKKPTYNG